MRDPITILQDLEARARRDAVGLPRVEEVREQWQGIGFSVGGQFLTVPMDEVRELLNYPRLSRVPGAKQWVKGVANVRGRLLTIIDLENFLLGTTTRVQPRSRILALREETAPTGFLVEKLTGMRHFFLENYVTDLTGTADWLSGYLKGVFREEGVNWGVLDIQALTKSPEFVHVAV